MRYLLYISLLVMLASCEHGEIEPPELSGFVVDSTWDGDTIVNF